MTEYQMLLGRADIDTAAGRIERFLTEEGIARRDVLRLRLTMEELLLRIRDARGRNTPCVLALGKRLGRVHIQLRYPGAAYDPTVIYRENDGEAWSEQLLIGIGVVPAWSWRRGVNRLALTPPGRPRPGFIGSALAIALALLLGFAAGTSDAAWADVLTALVLTPLFDLFFNTVGTFVGLTLFFSVVCGVCGIGETSAFERVGRVVTGRCIGATLLWSAAGCVLFARFFFSLRFGEPTPDTGAYGGALVTSFLCGIVPADPISPFQNRNYTQILFLAFLCGTALLTLGEQGGRVRDWASQCNAMLLAILERVSSLLPLFVFAALLRQLLNGSLPRPLTIWKPLAAFGFGSAVMLSAKLLAASLALKVSPGKLIKLLWPSYLLALTTSSSSSAFGLSMDTCERELGISHKLVLVGLSVDSVLCAPSDTLCFAVIALYLAELNRVPVSVGWLCALVLLNAAVCLALPPIPGAYLMCAGILLTQLGIPPEGLGVIAALNAVFDAFGTANQNAYVQLELALQAKRLKLLNEAALERLRKS